MIYYIRLYVFWSRKAKSDTIFDVRSTWARTRTRSRTKKLKSLKQVNFAFIWNIYYTLTYITPKQRFSGKEDRIMESNCLCKFLAKLREKYNGRPLHLYFFTLFNSTLNFKKGLTVNYCFIWTTTLRVETYSVLNSLVATLKPV